MAYEFLNIGGRKMSTSKGTGATAHGIAELLPPELLRFLFLRHKPRRAIEFDPEGDTIPGLFDEFDRIAAAVAGRPTRGELPADPAAILRQSLVDPDADVAIEAARFRPAFRHLALLVQVPGVDVAERMAAEKGEPLDEVERAILEERVRVARAWLESFAPERYRVEVQDTLPDGVTGLTEAQRIMLGSLAASAEGAAPDSGAAWQDLIFGTSQTYGVSSGDAFAAMLSRLPGPDQRAPCRLAPGEPRPRVRHPAPARCCGRRAGPNPVRGGRAGARPVSVGLPRLRDDAATVRQGAIAKGEDPARVEEALALDRQRREALGEADGLRAERKSLSDSIGATIKGGAAPNGPEVADLRARSTALGERISELDAIVTDVEARLEDLLLQIPNPPDADVPVGDETRERHRAHAGASLVPTPGADGSVVRPHWEVAEALGIIDLAAGAKVAGSGFPVYRGAGAALQRSLIDYFLDLHTREHGFTEIWPPALVNTASARGTGQIPDKEDLMYAVTRDELFLVPTAEVPVTNIHRDEIIEADRLPIRYVAYSPCFRREAGAAGKATRGILRVHQFDKVEMVLLRASRGLRCGAGVAHRARGDRAPAAGVGVSGQAHGHRRHGLHPGQEVRPRGLGARCRGLAGGQLGLQLPGLPGTPHEHPLATGARRQAGDPAHAQRVGAGAGTDRRGDPRDLPGPRWHGAGAGRTAPAAGRPHRGLRDPGCSPPTR